MKEIWKEVPSYEGYYQVSNIGRVKSVSREIWNGHSLFISKEKMLKPNTLCKGYLQVTLHKPKEKRKCYQVHRLVAMAFIENPKNYPQVNHIDGNKKHNNVDNLEWCTNSYNQIHAWKNGLNHVGIHRGGIPKRKIILFNENERISFDSIADASKWLGQKSHSWLSKVLRGKSNSIHGYKAKYNDIQ